MVQAYCDAGTFGPPLKILDAFAILVDGLRGCGCHYMGGEAVDTEKDEKIANAIKRMLKEG